MEEDDIAAAMGFSSFGGTKKRKYDQANSPKAKADVSGANTTKLGMRSKVAASSEHEDFETPHASSATAHGQTLPEIPRETRHVATTFTPVDTSATETMSFGGPPISRGELNTLRFGVKDEKGDTVYFLPSFVEDPWENFMKSDK
ncbi:hypothetical protein P153DRAFT_278840 [Dothidotthia symphoricarpi CBS 119687]|uniref:Uncharacterized protein n=1 Tax=Dothidotthia symphoricarpi CBS 119687 TaxID=1392245 RepID=A0A6A6AVA6_9PLEO|nr:uncharacterized protein P153DRAFT_278840 [Dothidotthia symphoricarpi CBS 119687]KAF2134895.1 hypothetical protein P153DRAFT_278840 [Dothidotthia symphoricarpi CBS 119687]